MQKSTIQFGIAYEACWWCLFKCGKNVIWCSLDLNKSNVWPNVVEIGVAFHFLTMMVFFARWQRWLTIKGLILDGCLISQTISSKCHGDYLSPILATN
jgi:hypothetical protein